jgi:hypothetical protein
MPTFDDVRNAIVWWNSSTEPWDLVGEPLADLSEDDEATILGLLELMYNSSPQAEILLNQGAANGAIRIGEAINSPGFVQPGETPYIGINLTEID